MNVRFPPACQPTSRRKKSPRSQRRRHRWMVVRKPQLRVLTRVAEEAVAVVVPVEETAPSQVAAEATSANADQPEASAATSTSVPELVQETQVEAPAEVQAVEAEGVPEAVATSEAAKVEDQPVASDLPPVETSSVSIASEAQISEAEKRAGNDAEVMAAIDSLAPSNGQAIASLSSLPQGSNGSGHQAHGSANHGSANQVPRLPPKPLSLVRDGLPKPLQSRWKNQARARSGNGAGDGAGSHPGSPSDGNRKRGAGRESQSRCRD